MWQQLQGTSVRKTFKDMPVKMKAVLWPILATVAFVMGAEVV